jgi:ABC-type transporter Mla MlaB component
MSRSIRFENELTIHKISENIPILSDALNTWDSVTIDIMNVRKMDVAAVQMLIAAKKESQKTGKELTVRFSAAATDLLTLIGVRL